MVFLLWFVEEMVLLLACGIVKRHLPCHKLYRRYYYVVMPPCRYIFQKTGAVFRSRDWSCWNLFAVFMNIGKNVGLFGDRHDWKMILFYIYVYWWTIFACSFIFLNQCLILSLSWLFVSCVRFSLSFVVSVFAYLCNVKLSVFFYMK